MFTCIFTLCMYITCIHLMYKHLYITYTFIRKILCFVIYPHARTWTFQLSSLIVAFTTSILSIPQSCVIKQKECLSQGAWDQYYVHAGVVFHNLTRATFRGSSVFRRKLTRTSFLDERESNSAGGIVEKKERIKLEVDGRGVG